MSFVESIRSNKLWISGFFLVLSNLYALYAVLSSGADIETVLFIFWIESGIIAFYTALKMIASVRNWASLLVLVFVVPMTAGHFGAFMTAHLFFISVITSEIAGVSSNDPFGIFIGRFVYDGMLVLSVLVPVIVLFISHGVSFAINYIGRGEYLTTDIIKLSASPYRRVIVMHVTLLIGGGLGLILGGGMVTIAFLILLKTATDLHAHINERKISSIQNPAVRGVLSA
jgi:hypothetical protein